MALASSDQRSSVCSTSVVRWITLLVLFVFAVPRPVDAQLNGQCRADRTMSTIVGAGLGAAAAAIPATIIHRHDQTTSHRIVAISIATGALTGFVAAGRDHPCLSAAPAESVHVGDAVLSSRSKHASRGGLAGFVTGAVVGAAGSAFLQMGCEADPCHPVVGRVGAAAFFAGEGGLAGGILGSLIGWAWPVKR